jgi:hypothetical protein
MTWENKSWGAPDSSGGLHKPNKEFRYLNLIYSGLLNIFPEILQYVMGFIERI